MLEKLIPSCGVGVNAFVYMVLGRMIYFFLPEKIIFGVKAASVAKYFVWLDVVSFTVQVVGGIMLSMNASAAATLDGTHVYMGGVGLQECFILCFMALAITFHRRMLVLESRGETAGRRGWKKLLFTLYAVLTLITVCRSHVFSAKDRILPIYENYRTYSLVFGTDPNYIPPHRVVRRCKFDHQRHPIPRGLCLLFGRSPSLWLYVDSLRCPSWFCSHRARQ